MFLDKSAAKLHEAKEAKLEFKIELYCLQAKFCVLGV